MSSIFQLLRDRRFLPLFGTQFFGAFNDNVYKQVLVMLLVFHTGDYSDLPAGLLTNLAAGLFILPFFIGSGVAAQLADRYDKAWLAQRLKMLECLLMAIAGIALAWQSLPLMLLVLFAMGAQSALFGPIKYAWLPERLPSSAIFPANALVETATSMAILLGSLYGGLLVATFGTDTAMATLSVIVLAVIGLLCSVWMPAGAAIAPNTRIDWHIINNTRRCLAVLRESRSRWQVSLSISWFWLFGVLWLTQLPSYCATYLGGDATVASVLLAVFSIGIALGSQLCQLAHRVWHTRHLIVIGGWGMTITSFLLPWQPLSADELLPLTVWLAQPNHWLVCATLAAVGMSAGLYIVPLYAHIQLHSQRQDCAQAIAGINVLNALFMVAGSLLAMLVLGLLQLSLAHLLLGLAVATAITTWRWRLVS